MNTQCAWRSLVLACGLAGAGLLASAPGCAGGDRAEGGGENAPPQTPRSGDGFALPSAVKELEGVAFMTGRWACPTPNGRLINREHWMAPAGTGMVGTFVQMRKDGGAVAFYELSTIVAEPEVKGAGGPNVVRLYHRHLHTRLEIDPRRADVDVFKLTHVGKSEGQGGGDFATFEPVKQADGGIKSVTYRLDQQGRLVQEVAFAPGSKEKDFSTVYQRED